MNHEKRIGLLVSLGVAAIMVLAALPVSATSLVLEKSQEWKATGDTIVYSTYAANVDSDSAVETLTAGKAYMGPMGGTQAQLRIWNWNDTNDTLTLEKSYEYSMYNSANSVFRGVAAGDVDGDSTPEIVTVGYYLDINNYYHDHLAVWQWNQGTGVLTREFEASQLINSTMRGVSVYNIDGDSLMEIATVGERGAPGNLEGKVYVFNWNGANAFLRDTESFGTYSDLQWRSVYIEDVSWDSTKEVIVAGYYVSSGSKYAQVRVYNYTNQDLSLITGGDYPWRFGTPPYDLDTESYSVYAGQLYSGGGNDIVACGSFNDGGTLKAEVRIIDYNKYTKSLRSPDWGTNWYNGSATECHGIYAVNLDAGSDLEIIAGGYGTYSGTQNGQVHVFNNNSGGVTDRYWAIWYTDSDTQVWSVYAKNVDGDSDTEVLSAGQARELRGDLRGQLRIWHWE